MPHVCTIIPPHLLKAIVDSDDIPEEVKHVYRNTLQTTASIRSARSQFAATHVASHAHAGGSSRHHGIIPPQILQNLARTTEEEDVDRHAAITTLEQDTKMRAARGQKKDKPAAPSGLNRTIYDYKHSTNEAKLPGTVVDIKEGGPPVPISKDKTNDANEAYEGFGDTYNFYKTIFSRNSIDNKDLPLIGTVHFGVKYQNAFWDGKQMVFGDGDGKIFLDFTSRPDVIAHELTHGVTEYTANLEYSGQSGALNESLSDCFGIMVKQWKADEKDASTANWLIGEGIWGPSIKGKALRSMSEPGTAYDDPKVGKDPQPATMANFLELPLDEDNDMGGVHLNSGIPNKAFYEVSVRIGGSSWEGAGPIWYKTLTGGQLSSTASFQEFADLTYKNAGDHAQHVVDAWKAVGITVTESGSGSGGPEQSEL